MARVAHAYDGTISSNLLKALTLHRARVPVTGGLPNHEEIRYFGFGKPANLDQVLSCREEAATFILEGEVTPGYEIDIPDFPYPPALIRDGRCLGTIAATLVYDPPLDERGGGTYIRSNLNFSMGTYTIEVDDKGKQRLKYTRQVHPQPAFGGGLYERELVENGWKWAPYKTYYRNLSRGVGNTNWRVVVEMLNRDELDIKRPQKFAGRVVLPAVSQHILELYLRTIPNEPDQPLFPGLSYPWLWRRFVRWRNQSGLSRDIGGPHVLRHTFATLSAEGADLQ